MSKRFLVNGKADLHVVENQIVAMEEGWETSREDINCSVRQAAAHLTGSLTPAKILEITQKLKHRHDQVRTLGKSDSNLPRKSC